MRTKRIELSGAVASLALLILAVAVGCGHRLQLLRPLEPPARAQRAIDAAERALRRGQLRRAVAKAQLALGIDQHLARAHELLGLAAALADDSQRASYHFNRALQDGRSRLTALHLQLAVSHAATREQRQQLLGLVEQIARHHHDRRARSEARSALAELYFSLGKSSALQTTVRGLSPILSWYGISGFDNEESAGYDTPYPPERELRLKATYPVSRGRAGWQRIVGRGSKGVLDLRSFFYPFYRQTAYLVTFFKAKEPQPARLRLVISDPTKVWLNGELVFASREVQRFSTLRIEVPVALRAGANKLQVKSCQGGGGWALGAAFETRDGHPMALEPILSPSERVGAPMTGRPGALSRHVAWVDKAARAPGRRSFWRAVALSLMGMRNPALTALREHLRRWPRDPIAALWASRLAYEAGQHQLASQLIRSGMRLKGEYRARFLVERSRVLRRRGQKDRALEAVRQAQILLQQVGRASGARATSVPKVRSQPPHVPRSRRVLLAMSLVKELDRLFLRNGWALDRCTLARRVARVLPGWSWPYRTMASCAQSLGRTEDATAALERALDIAPGSHTVAYALANAYAGRGQCGRALSVQERLSGKWPDDPRAIVGLGDLLRRCNRREAAFAAYRRAVGLNPGWGRPFRQVGLLHYEAGQLEKALASFREALKRDPDDSNLWDRITALSPDRDPILDRYQPTERDIAKAIIRSRYAPAMSGASIVWLMDDEVTRVMPDGTVKRLVTTVRKAVDRGGRDRLGEARLPRHGLVKVLDAFAIDRRGRRREVTSMHGRRIRYPKLDEGAVVVLRYRHVQQPGGYLRQHFAAAWYFQNVLGQIESARWVLALPAERKLNLHITGKVDHVRRKSGDLSIHTFSTQKVPPLRPEGRSLPIRDLLRSVTVSTVPSWAYFSSWGRSLTSEVFEITPELKDELQKIAAGAKTVDEKVRRVYRFVLTKIRYQQDYETFIAGVKPHTASAVLARGYGDCKDKSVLIIAMLRELGVKARFALIRTRGKGRVLPSVPSQQFNHAIVYLPAQRGVRTARFLDATAENLDIGTLRRDVQGTIALVLSGGGHELVKVPYQKPDRNWTATEISLALDGDGAARGHINLRAVGHTAGAMRKPLQNAEIQRRVGEGLLHMLFPSSTLKNVTVLNHRDVTRPLVLQLAGAFQDVARREGKTLRWRLPEHFSLRKLGSWSERHHALFFGPPSQDRYEVSLRLPDGYELTGRPSDIKLNAVDGCYSIQGTWDYQKAMRTLRYVQKVRRYCPMIAPGRYARLREMVRRLEQHVQQELTLSPSAKRSRSLRVGGKTKGRGRSAGGKRNRR